MDSLNLDIDSYTPFDLQNLFTLSPGFSSSDVNKGKIKLLQQLEKTKSLGSESKRRIAFFIDTASSRLGGMSGKKDDNAGTWAMKENPMDTGSSHFVISDPNVLAGKNATITDGRQAGTDDVPPGWLNPINVRTVMHGLNIDTRFRDNYYDTNASDFAFNLPDTQKKVSNMRIATLDIPMTYYSVDRTRGDSTMLIFYTDESDKNSWTTSPDPSDVKSYFGITDTDTSYFGVWQGEGKYSTITALPPPTLEGVSYDAGWLLILPNGNYEMAWQSQSEAQDITRAMNSAIAMAQPCIHDRGSGKTYILLDSSKKPYIANGLGGKLVYSVDRTSGRSIFALPDTAATTSGPSITGFQLVFPVDHSGNYDPSTNIQLHLGWHLGFRAGIYDCNYDSDSDSGTSVFSEGICMVCGPRYMYISIDDGNHNSGSNFTAVFAESTLGEHIMTRINLASSMDSAGVFKCASDVGLSNQLNRTREFFGPVDISRLKIRLLDEYGRVINLNHMDWSMSLVFEKLYD